MAEPLDINHAIDAFQRCTDAHKQPLNPQQAAEYMRRLSGVEELFGTLVAGRPEMQHGIYQAFDTGRTVNDMWDERRGVFIQLSRVSLARGPRQPGYDVYGLDVLAVDSRIDPTAQVIRPDVVYALPVAGASFSTLHETVATLEDLRAYHLGLEAVSDYLGAQAPDQQA